MPTNIPSLQPTLFPNDISNLHTNKSIPHRSESKHHDHTNLYVLIPIIILLIIGGGYLIYKIRKRRNESRFVTTFSNPIYDREDNHDNHDNKYDGVSKGYPDEDDIEDDIDDDFYNGDNFSDEIEKDDLYDDVYDDPDLLSEESINDDYMVIEGEN